MEILECITEQIAGNRLPLVGVTVAAVPCPDTPIILTLHWHGFRKEARGDDAQPASLASVPSTSLQVNERWTDLLDVEMATMEAGWELGAWDVVRAERPPCVRPGASAAEAADCLKAFGSCPMSYLGAELFVADAPDMDDLIGVAAQAGYLFWQFQPVHGGIWAEVRHDPTLNADGTRAPHCPLTPQRPQCDGKRRTVYRFGSLHDAAS